MYGGILYPVTGTGWVGLTTVVNVFQALDVSLTTRAFCFVCIRTGSIQRVVFVLLAVSLLLLRVSVTSVGT